MIDSLIISGPTVYAEQGVLKNVNVEISQGHIKAINAFSSQKKLNFPSSYHLIPGLIDLHVHGANGKDVMDANAEALATMSKALAAEGVTGFLATTMTAAPDHIEKALRAVRAFTLDQQEGARILGVHLEGPFISPKKVGAQSRDHLLPLDLNYIHHWQTLADLKIVTLAPELPGSEAFIRYLVEQGIIPSIGHTDATFEEAMAAIDSGCSHVTHLFNAMRGMHQREPGTVSAALLSNQVTTEIIVDGVHVHPALIQLTLKLKGKDQLILVTDAMRAKCLCDGRYELGGQWVDVKDAIARLADGTLAGSTLTMPRALKNSMQYMHCDLATAVKMASENPAKKLKMFDQLGSISPEKKANLVVLDEHLNVVLTLIEGQICFEVKEKRAFVE